MKTQPKTGIWCAICPNPSDVSIGGYDLCERCAADVKVMDEIGVTRLRGVAVAVNVLQAVREGQARGRLPAVANDE